MVFDRIEHASFYFGLGAPFQQALEWIAHVDPSTLVPGEKIILDGDNIFAFFFEVDTLPREACQLEGHRNYADIQYIVKGEEALGYASLGTADVTIPYDVQKDIGFWNNNWDTLTLCAGNFYIVWPQDLHAPRVACGSPTPVSRLVVKVKL